MIHKFKDRNIEITVKVLEGMTLRQVSIKYDITPERLRQVVINTCRRYLLPKRGIWRNKDMDGIYDLKTVRGYWKNGTLNYGKE